MVIRITLGPASFCWPDNAITQLPAVVIPPGPSKHIAVGVWHLLCSAFPVRHLPRTPELPTVVQKPVNHGIHIPKASDLTELL